MNSEAVQHLPSWPKPELEVGQAAAITDGSEVVVVTLNAVNAGDVTSEDAGKIRNALSSQFNATLSNDMYAAFAVKFRRARVFHWINRR